MAEGDVIAGLRAQLDAARLEIKRLQAVDPRAKDLMEMVESRDAEIKRLKAAYSEVVEGSDTAREIADLKATVKDLEKHRGSLLDNLAELDVRVATQKLTIKDLQAERDDLADACGKQGKHTMADVRMVFGKLKVRQVDGEAVLMQPVSLKVVPR